jgi:hypothetical protein
MKKLQTLKIPRSAEQKIRKISHESGVYEQKILETVLNVGLAALSQSPLSAWMNYSKNSSLLSNEEPAQTDHQSPEPAAEDGAGEGNGEGPAPVQHVSAFDFGLGREPEAEEDPGVDRGAEEGVA